MARRALLSLLTLWVLAGDLPLGPGARGPPCTVWREALRPRIHPRRHLHLRGLAVETLGFPGRRSCDAFLNAEADTDRLAGELDEAVSSSEWLSPNKSPQAFYGGRPGWQGTPGAPRGSRDVLAGLSGNCCKWGCSKSEISSLC
ncbi:Relaxin-3 [Tupaia chinensis]|uniref:Relaxin-3 n=1 Tax=Tupaia chinensis TaxID=246437 RepID=L8YD30_TUPCH|nr:Relaxin-3 [Tupaia chinensis]